MPWNTPPTFAAGQVVTAADLNSYLRDNPNYLLAGRQYTASVYVGSADASSTSTIFADVDPTNVIISFTPKSTRARVIFVVYGFGGTTSNLELDIYNVTAGVRLGDATHGSAVVNNNRDSSATVHGIATGLTVGASNSFKLQFRATVAANAVVVNKNGFPIYMFVEEF